MLQSSDASLTAALIEPVLDRFVDLLESVAAIRPDLADRCHDLASDLRQFLDPEPTREAYDDEIPF